MGPRVLFELAGVHSVTGTVRDDIKYLDTESLGGGRRDRRLCLMSKQVTCTRQNSTTTPNELPSGLPGGQTVT